MKTKILIILLFSLLYKGYSQKNCKTESIPNSLKAKGATITESILYVKYGKPVYLEIEGVNTFLNKSYATYVPINFDFSTSAFLGKKIEPENDETPENSDGKVEKGKKESTKNSPEAFAINESNRLSTKNNQLWSLEIQRDVYKDSLSSIPLNTDAKAIDDKIKQLEIKIKEKEVEIELINKKIDSVVKNNEVLRKKIELLMKTEKSKTEFIKNFKKYQTVFSNVNECTSLKNKLLSQIKEASVFIDDVVGFKDRSKTTFNSIYKNDTDLDKKKKLIVKSLDNLNDLYFKLSADYQNINEILKKKKYEFKGEVKDGKNVLKFDKIEANLEIKYLFEDEMNKAKKINDSLSLPKHRKSIITESQEGIDLYHKISKDSCKTTVASPFIYSDKANITFNLKNNQGVVTHKYDTLTVKTYGRLRVNGSAGYFLNFISDDNYGIRKKVTTDTNSKTGVTESNSNAVKHSLGGLIHAYWDFKGDVDLGASVGLGINDSSNTSFYLGLSGLFLDNSRLVFTTGISFINVSRLNTSNLVKNNQNQYDFTNESDTEIKYDKVFKPSFFVGISYNLL